MKDFFQTLQDAFPILKNHPVGMARLLLFLLVLVALYRAKGLRKRLCQPLLSRLCQKIFVTSRWLYVYQDSQTVNDWKYYTSEVTGKGNTGDDMVWTLVSWPNLKPKDSFTLSGVVGMVDAVHQSQAKLLGRWNIVHDPDLQPIGPVPARGFKKQAPPCVRQSPANTWVDLAGEMMYTAITPAKGGAPAPKVGTRCSGYCGYFRAS